MQCSQAETLVIDRSRKSRTLEYSLLVPKWHCGLKTLHVTFRDAGQIGAPSNISLILIVVYRFSLLN